jgi:hypothetical protein
MLVDGLNGTGDQVTAAIRSASRTTGTTFYYLLKTAIRESSLDPAASAKTSSARGLYQFIESTWLAMVKEEGPKYGLGQLANAIERRPDGQYAVSNPAARSEILKLREDPAISSVMAGALAKRNSAELAETLGRKPTGGELYLAHFLGAGGAKRMIELSRNNPNASAAAAFPDAARANKSIFHGANGKARSAGEVFAALTGKHDTTPVRRDAIPMRHAAAKQTATFANLRPTLSSDPVSAPQRNGPAPRVTYAHPVVPSHSAFAAEEGPAFQALFRDGTKSHEALSPAVRELWGSFDAGSRGLKEIAGGMKTAAIAPGAIGEPLDLLGHLRNSSLHAGRRTKLGG